MKTCVIFDNEEGYGKRLFSGFLKKAESAFNVVFFTGEEELKRYLTESLPEVLVLCQEGLENTFKRIMKGKIIILTDEAVIREEPGDMVDAPEYIYRYQSLERIYNQVVIKGELKKNGRLKTLDIIGVYSPMYVAPKTSFAMALAKAYSERYKTMYLNLEEFSGLDEVLPSDNDYTLSDALYYYKQGKRYASERILETIKEISCVSYIPPVVCAEDLSSVENRELMEFVEMLGKELGFEVVVLDLSGAIKQPWKVMEYCNAVYIPVRDDYISKRKLEMFESYYSSMGMDNVFNSFQKVRLPEGESDLRSDFWDKVLYSGMYRYVKKLLESEVSS